MKEQSARGETDFSSFHYYQNQISKKKKKNPHTPGFSNHEIWKWVNTLDHFVLTWLQSFYTDRISNFSCRPLLSEFAFDSCKCKKKGKHHLITGLHCQDFKESAHPEQLHTHHCLLRSEDKILLSMGSELGREELKCSHRELHFRFWYLKWTSQHMLPSFYALIFIDN